MIATHIIFRATQKQQHHQQHTISVKCLVSDNAIDAKRLRRKVLFLKLDERRKKIVSYICERY